MAQESHDNTTKYYIGIIINDENYVMVISFQSYTFSLYKNGKPQITKDGKLINSNIPFRNILRAVPNIFSKTECRLFFADGTDPIFFSTSSITESLSLCHYLNRLTQGSKDRWDDFHIDFVVNEFPAKTRGKIQYSLFSTKDSYFCTVGQRFLVYEEMSSPIPLFVVPLYQVRLLEISSSTLLLSTVNNYYLSFTSEPLKKQYYTILKNGIDHAIEFEDHLNSEIDNKLFNIWTPKKLHALLLTDEVSVNDSNITTKKEIYIWGNNQSSQLGLGIHFIGQKSTIPLPAQNVLQDFEITSMAIGEKHCAVVTSDGRILTWGEGMEHQLGYECRVTSRPLLIPYFYNNPIKSICCGATFTLVLTKNGIPYSWGTGYEGQLGLGIDVTVTHSPQQVLIPGSQIVTQISCSNSHCLFLCQNGDIYGTGCSINGQLGLDSQETIFTTQRMKLSNQKAVSVCCGLNFSAFFDSSGLLYFTGKLGINEDSFLRSVKDFLSPHFFQLRYQKIVYRAKFIAAGYYHLAIIGHLGKKQMVFTIGGKHQDELNSTPTLVNVPLELYDNVIDLQCGNGYTFVLLENKQMFGWGVNQYGQLGINHSFDTFTPCIAQFPPDVNPIKVFCGSTTSACLTTRLVDIDEPENEFDDNNNQ